MRAALPGGQTADELLAEYFAAELDHPEQAGQTAEQAALRAAIFIEDVFDVVIPEGQLDAEHLSAHRAGETVAALLAQQIRSGGRDPGPRGGA